jgi:hypothetical protein
MVLPFDEALPGDVVEALARLEVELLYFRLDKKRVMIVDAVRRLTNG